MLIDSPRLTSADREHWQRLEHYDDVLSRDPALDRLEAQAREAIRAFATAGECIVSTSWGKDSTVVAHLAATSGVDIPLVWVRARHFEMPECEQVRDAFLATHPDVRYEERLVTLRNPKRGEAGHPAYLAAKERGEAHSQDVLKEVIRERYISGVRAEESRIRAISIAHRGTATRHTCRPIGRWTAVHVFAYLYRENLPVHPAYAMTVGGQHDRRWLRVHPLCSAAPPRSAVHGWDMDAWEDRYWPDIIGAAHKARAHMWDHYTPEDERRRG